MKNQSRHFITLSLAAQLLFSSVTFAGPWPALETDKEKLSYGLGLRHAVPGFFSGTFNYGMDWWTITDAQNQIKKQITPLYSPQEDIHPLAVITLQQKIAKEVPSQAARNQWIAELIQELRQHRAATTKRELLAELDVKLRAVSEIKPSELLNQLMKVSMENERNFEIMKSPLDVKLDFLRQRLPEDLSQTKFYGNSNKRYSPDNVKSTSHAIKLIRELVAYEAEIPNLVGLAILTEALPAGSDVNRITHHIEQLKGEHFIALQDSAQVETHLRTALNQGPVQHGAGSDIAKSAAASLNKKMQGMMAAGAEKVELETPVLRLVETPRDFAILRSAVALDCTHTCSFAKADLPTHRVLYVVDPTQNGKELGYVETEIRGSPQGDVLYLTSINGPSLTPEQAEIILNMLQQKAAELGVAKLAIAAHHLEFQMNYQPIIDAVKGFNAGKPVIPVWAKNKQITEVVDRFLDADYQKDYRNTEAIIFDATMPELKTTFETRPNNASIPRAINKKEALVFALELDAAQRTATEAGHLTDGERAAVAAEIKLEDYRQLRKILQNDAHLPYQESLDKTREAFARANIEVDKAFLKNHAHIFYDAQLAASDAVEGPLKKSTFGLVAQLLKRGLWHPTWGLEAFGRDPKKVEAFNQSKELEGVLRWATTDLNFHSIQVRNIVNAGLAHPQMREPEMVRSLLRLVVHGWSWGPDLSQEILKAVNADVSSYTADADAEVREGAKKYLKRFPVPKPPAPPRANPKSRSLKRTCEGIFAISS